MKSDHAHDTREVFLSIVIPCLNEEETLEKVLRNCLYSIEVLGKPAEVIVADNGSTDSSKEIARRFGVNVVEVATKGYGAAILGGIKQSRGKYVVMGDADDSYELENISEFVATLEQGFDLVMGNRFRGGIDDGAMPILHRYLGNPVLSLIGRKLFNVCVGDFHCGIRAFKRESILKLELKSDGMEFASEMVVKAALNSLTITEIPTKLRRDGRSRRPHLRTWRDGWRHLVFLLAASPRWLFVYPAICLIAIGLLGIAFTVTGEVTVATWIFNLNAFLFFLAFLINGSQLFLLSILARVFSSRYGFLPQTSSTRRFEHYFTLERGLFLGLFLLVVSIPGIAYLFSDWTGNTFTDLDLESSLKISGLVILNITLGVQLIFASFFAALLNA